MVHFYSQEMNSLEISIFFFKLQVQKKDKCYKICQYKQGLLIHASYIRGREAVLQNGP